MNTGGILENHDLSHEIRLVYASNNGRQRLVSTKMTSHLRAVLKLPKFDRKSSNPQRLHVKAVYEVVKSAGWEICRSFEEVGDNRHSLVLEIKNKKQVRPVFHAGIT